MLNRWYTKFRRHHVRALVATVVLAIPMFTFQNCSEQQFTSLNVNAKSIPSGLFRINNGAVYTNNMGVMAQIEAFNALQMTIKNGECPAEDAEFVDLKTEAEWLLADADGNSEVYLRLRDQFGQVSGCIEANIILDRKAPTLEFLSGAERISAVNAGAFDMKSMDEVSGVDKVYCRIPGSTEFSPCDMQFTLQNLGEGGQAVTAYSVDKAGNQSAPVDYSFFVDLTPPTVAFVEPYPPAISTINSVTLNFSGSDGTGSGVERYECRLNDGAIAPCASPSVLPDLANGDYIYSVRAIDRAGHMSAFVSAQFKVDTDPAGEFQILGVSGGSDEKVDGYLSALVSPKLHWSASMGAESYSIAIYDAANAAMVCPTATVAGALTAYQFPNTCVLVDGQKYTARASAMRNGLVRVANPYLFTVDASAPVIRIISVAKDDEKKTAKVTFAVSDAGSGLKNVTCYKKYKEDVRVDDCMNKTSIDYAELSNGDHEFYISATDNLDHMAQSLPSKFTINYIVCDPFNLVEGQCVKGLKANLYYASKDQRDAGDLRSQFPDVGDLIEKGVKSAAVIYLPYLHVPARDWTDGFSTVDGEYLKDDDDNKLDEWFALEMESVIKLGDGDLEGYYQFMIMSDDGANMYIKKTPTEAFTHIINNDGIHSTRVGCADKAHTIYMTRNSRIPMKIEYYQGPRTRIAMSLFWRKVNKADSSTSSLCGTVNQGEETFYETITNDTYKFKALSAPNFILNEGMSQ